VILAGRRINDDMGKFIAQRAVKLMINSGITLRGARIGILGVTFKENVTDTRNSRIPDIALELKEFGIEPVVYDPVADAEEVFHEYRIELKDRSELNGLQGVILAVPHREILNLGAQSMSAMVEPGGVFIDVKSVFSAEDVGQGVGYWSL
jgi:UDP-N-acetyl-D-galactosamine dehydrogenase